MKSLNLSPLAVAVLFAATASCQSNSETTETVTEEPMAVATVEEFKKEPHPYGGWYCPDNLTGFPPVNAQDVASISVIADRLPTKEETYDGRSLIYFDPEIYPNAKAVDIGLPRIANYEVAHTGQAEKVVIIQAVESEGDTVVGFRYLNGGNGSAWLSEVDLLEESEVSDLGNTPFVFIETEIDASQKELWKAIAGSEYAQGLGLLVGSGALFQQEWEDVRQHTMEHVTDDLMVSSFIGNHFGGIYFQTDYNETGDQYVEKILVLANEDGTSKVQIASGPYPNDLEAQQEKWNAFLKGIGG